MMLMIVEVVRNVKRYAALLCLIIAICLIAGCNRPERVDSIIKSPEPTTPIVAESPSPQAPASPSVTPEIESLSPSPKENDPFIPKINANGQYEVTNTYELTHSIGSQREILLYPGDYTASINLDGFNDLSIIGMPADGMEYIAFSNDLSFFNCSNIKISNLELDGSDRHENLVFTDSRNITIEHCKITATDDYSDLHYGSGIKLKYVIGVTCRDTIIQGYTNNIDLYSTKNTAFEKCTLIGGPLQIGDFLNDGPCENTVFKDSTLLCEAGICSTWNNYVPIADKSGYEIDIGTEEWQERRFLSAIMFNNQKHIWHDLHYINTYNGSISIYEDGKFIELAERLNGIKSITAFPSVDYVAADDADWNQYYNFYGVPETIKLNINILESDANPDIEKLMRKTLMLDQAADQIIGTILRYNQY